MEGWTLSCAVRRGRATPWPIYLEEEEEVLEEEEEEDRRQRPL